MKRLVFVGASLSPDYKRLFKKRCIDHGTTMDAVVKAAIQQWLESHPPRDDKGTGVM